MKNKILKGLFGLGVFALALSVNAQTLNSVEEGSNATSYDVTVGSVAVPVYSVDIKWGAMSFDWTYNTQIQDYEWTRSKIETCGHASPMGQMGSALPKEFDTFYYQTYTEEEFNELKANNQIYSDDTCQTVATEVTYENFGMNMYYTIQNTEAKSSFTILDNSTSGAIVPSVRWNSATGYDWTLGEFKYVYNETSCSEVTSSEELESLKQASALYTSNSCDVVASEDASYDDGNTYFKHVYNDGVGTLTNGSPLPANARMFAGAEIGDNGIENYSYGYNLLLNLKKDNTKAITNPKAGDKIGSVTITIAAKN